MSEQNRDTDEQIQANMTVTLEALPERRLIPHAASVRRIDYRIQVSAAANKARAERAPLTLALVIDRSGSMSGDKIMTAKRAALTALNELDERDTAAVVIFDDQIDTIQSATPVTPAIKRHVARELEKIQARGSTALHEGWLTGCHAIVGQGASGGLARCFLLTDGLANVGIQDPEQIATEAGGIRRNAGIGTSTFGVGLDYAEELLGPMAEAGGGQFHNLRTAEEIAHAFAGELGELLLTAAANVRLEIEAEAGATVELLSIYHTQQDADHPYRWSAMIGDLIGGEERHVLTSVNFPLSARREAQTVRARVLWTQDGAEKATEWSPLTFTYATDAECDSEQPDAEIAQRIGEALSDRAQREALTLSKRGDFAGARMFLANTSSDIQAYAASAPMLAAELDDIADLNSGIAGNIPLASHISKEVYFQRQMRSKGQRDQRQASKPPAKEDGK
jgi:Ca-activated chloride channel family protein